MFALSATGAMWTRVALNERALESAIRNLRDDLDPTGGTARAAAALDDDIPEAAAARFDAATAHALYRDLVAPVADVLSGKQRVYVVQERALAGLPMSILLSAPVEITTEDDLRDAPWLLRDHAFATMPSINAIATRGQSNPRAPTLAFAGFGDPIFAGNATHADLAMRVPGGTDISDLAPLPGTRTEINTLALAMQGDASATFLGTNANETTVKTRARSA